MQDGRQIGGAILDRDSPLLEVLYVLLGAAIELHAAEGQMRRVGYLPRKTYRGFDTRDPSAVKPRIDINDDRHRRSCER